MWWRQGWGKGICLTEEGEKIITNNLNVGGDGDGVDTIEEHDDADSDSSDFYNILIQNHLGEIMCARRNDYQIRSVQNKLHIFFSIALFLLTPRCSLLSIPSDFFLHH
jgi:hypothetical protein